MSVTVLPDFDSISEFGGYNGDCFFSAVLSGLHSIDPVRWPLNFTTLDALVKDAYGKGLAEASGAINVAHASAWLTTLGVAHETYCSYAGALPGDTAPYNSFTLDDGSPTCLHQQMKARSGHQPIIIERGVGAPLPGDEPTVVYHYLDDGGVDTGPLGDGVGGAYLFSDGDNSADPSSGAPIPPIRYSWPQIAAIGVVGFIVLTQARVHVAIVLEHDAAGTIVAAHDADNPAMRVSEGIAQTISAHEKDGWLGAEIFVSTDDMSKDQLPSGIKIAILRGEAKVVITWSQTNGIQTSSGDTVVAMEELYTLWQAAKNATPPAPPAPPAPVNVKAQVAALSTDLASLVTTLGAQAQ